MSDKKQDTSSVNNTVKSIGQSLISEEVERVIVPKIEKSGMPEDEPLSYIVIGHKIEKYKYALLERRKVITRLNDDIALGNVKVANVLTAIEESRAWVNMQMNELKLEGSGINENNGKNAYSNLIDEMAQFIEMADKECQKLNEIISVSDDRAKVTRISFNMYQFIKSFDCLTADALRGSLAAGEISIQEAIQKIELALIRHKEILPDMRRYCAEHGFNRRFCDFYINELKEIYVELNTSPQKFLETPNNNGGQQDWFLNLLQERSPNTYRAVKNALKIGLVEQDGKQLLFNCKIGTVAHIFKFGGFTEWGEIARAVKIKNGKLSAKSLATLACYDATKEYREIKKKIFID